MLIKNYLSSKHKLSIKILAVISFCKFTYTMDLPKSYLQNISAAISALDNRFESLPAKFSQTDAFMSIPALKDYAGNFFSTNYHHKLLMYEELINKMLEREREYKDKYYVFYHATDSRFFVYQELLLALCKLKTKCKSEDKFIILRNFDSPDFKKDLKKGGIAKTSLSKWMDKKSSYLTQADIAFNNRTDVQPFFLAVNLSLYANLGRPNSNTLVYFFDNRTGTTPPFKKLTDEVIDQYVTNSTLQKKYSDKLRDISEALDNITKVSNKIGMMLQIFIPKKLVDELVYLSKQQGYYWDYKIPGDSGLDSFYDTTRKRYTKVSPILKRYQNEPDKLVKYYKDPGTPNENLKGTLHYIDPIFTNPTGHKEHIVLDRFEGRIFLKKEYFATPKSGILIYRYTALTEAQEKKYRDDIDALVKEISEGGKN